MGEKISPNSRCAEYFLFPDNQTQNFFDNVFPNEKDQHFPNLAKQFHFVPYMFEFIL
jgi:hypothetical protein